MLEDITTIIIRNISFVSIKFIMIKSSQTIVLDVLLLDQEGTSEEKDKKTQRNYIGFDHVFN